ncbi:hypothetical protein BCV70DRAFT_109337 [Testicularia cyperi]|uniref:Uncharacterized protein n=1 Tax=Testicularia cyperi TaxID=1882483 RepID=A0A317XR33_9BASI|nr:hypothetical protein BCV70DRAFT_109337 [Testicularia cyperi]
MSDPLDPSALLSVLPTLLPNPEAASTSSTVGIRNPQDALAAMIHTIMSRLDFRLVGLADDDRLQQPEPDSGTSADASTSRSSAGINKLPASWNEKGPEHYTFRYKHDQSSLDYLVKLVKLGGKALIHGIALQGSHTSSLELPFQDYFSTAFWPYPSTSSAQEPLVNGYISSSRLKDLVVAFKTQILQTLVPGLRKDGYTEEHHGATSSTGSGGQANRTGRHPSGSGNGSGSGADPRAPRPPFAGDEDDPTLPSELNRPFRNPLIIGDRDLDPLGGSPMALPPRFGGGGGGGHGGFAPPPLFPGGDNGGGMMVGPNHPMFRDRFTTPRGGGDGSGGLPPGAVPPGARFDPIFPDSAPGAGPRFDPSNPHPDVGGRNPQGGRGGGFNPASGDPDWDELAPPRPRQGPPGFGGPGGGVNRFGGAGGSDHWYA